MGKSVDRIELSATTERLRRNLVAVSALIIAIVGFDVRVEQAAHSGLELTNLTTDVIVWILLGLLTYHAFAFGVRALEDYKYWRIKLADRPAIFLGGTTGSIVLAKEMKEAVESLKSMNREKDLSQKAFEDGVKKLEPTLKAAERYAKGFENFPTVTLLRFVIWDVALAYFIALAAILFATSALPAGLLTNWISGRGSG